MGSELSRDSGEQRGGTTGWPGIQRALWNPAKSMYPSLSKLSAIQTRVLNRVGWVGILVSGTQSYED